MLQINRLIAKIQDTKNNKILNKINKQEKTINKVY